MTRKNLMSVACVLVLCLLACGCIPVKNVEKAWSTSKPDKDLAGLWLQAGGGDGKIAFIATDKDFLITSGTSGLDGGCRTVETNGHKFIIVANLRAAVLGFDQVDDDGKDGTLIRYKLEGDSLSIYTYDQEKINAAIKDGSVPGVMDENDSGKISELDEKTLAWLGKAADGPGWDLQKYDRKK